MITLDLSILNQKGTPMFYSDTLANRPAAGIVGRIFIATDSPFGIFRDTGTAWEQIAGSGGGGGNTIYTADDTLTSNRIVSSGGFTLTFAPQTTFLSSLTAATNASRYSALGQNTLSYAAGFSSSNLGLTYGAIGGINLQTFAGSATFAQSNLAAANISVNSVDFSAAGSTITMTQAAGLRVMAGHQSQFQYQGTNSGTITHAAISQNLGFYRPPSSTGILTITNAYGHLINDLNDYGSGFIFTNRWGTYQAGASDKNYFAGNVLIGLTIDTGQKLQVSSDARIYGLTIGRGNGGISSNTAIGASALFSTTTGINNTAIGNSSLIALTSGNSNISISALVSLTTGSNNVGIGVQTLNAITSQSNNTAIGFNSMINSTGQGNVAIGFQTLQNNSTSDNVAIGYQVLRSLNIGGANSSVGSLSMRDTTTGGGNSCIGVQSLYTNTTGTSNVAMGYASGGFISGGSTAATNSNNSIFIGTFAFPLADSQTNQIVIGFQSVGLGSNTTTIGNSSINTSAIYGNLLLGSITSTGEKLQVTGSWRINGQSSATAGGSSGLHLIVNVDGTNYKIALLNV